MTSTRVADGEHATTDHFTRYWHLRASASTPVHPPNPLFSFSVRDATHLIPPVIHQPDDSCTVAPPFYAALFAASLPLAAWVLKSLSAISGFQKRPLSDRQFYTRAHVFVWQLESNTSWHKERETARRQRSEAFLSTWTLHKVTQCHVRAHNKQRFTLRYLRFDNKNAHSYIRNLQRMSDAIQCNNLVYIMCSSIP